MKRNTITQCNNKRYSKICYGFGHWRICKKREFLTVWLWKNTNPLLSKTPGVYSYNATSCATYTTAGVKCILEHKNTDDLYEILPNYLYRNDVDVIWRTTNWGEPPVHIKTTITKRVWKQNVKVKIVDMTAFF